MRTKFVVTILLVGALALLLGPTTGFTQFGGGGGDRGGRGMRGGGGGGGPPDPGRIFDFMSRGQPFINLAESNSRMREPLMQWAQKNGITDGKITREQFIAFSQEQMQNGGFGGPRPGGTPPAPGAPGGAPG